MSAVFADTAFYVATLSTRDSLHRSAMEFLADYDGHTVTTEFVLVEVGNFCSRVGKHRAFAELVRGLNASRMTVVVPSSRELFERGLALFESRADKEWSVTDCISFVVMQERGLTMRWLPTATSAKPGIAPCSRIGELSQDCRVVTDSPIL